MLVDFHKYHGNGNDFILIDNRSLGLKLSSIEIKEICHRHFGIGSDGIILIENDQETDFNMVFYNPDGSQSFCGNGSRCSLHFAFNEGIIEGHAIFRAIDGIHRGEVKDFHTRIQISDIEEVKRFEDCFFVNTGSPHAIVFVENVDLIEIATEASRIRHDSRFAPDGTNVNFVEFTDNGIRSRVFERGVENETLSSGSGTTAQAICSHALKGLDSPISVSTRGGNLKVEFSFDGNGHYNNIWLVGEVNPVFKGTLSL
ncbi:MAG: diaminopimelate epimerase [Vicingaceae bacterium]